MLEVRNLNQKGLPEKKVIVMASRNPGSKRKRTSWLAEYKKQLVAKLATYKKTFLQEFFNGVRNQSLYFGEKKV